MKPKIDKTKFGSITIEGEKYEHDVIIRLDGTVKKRKKKLSKAIYGTSHTISRDEAEYLYEKGSEGIVIGSGQQGTAHLSPEAEEFLTEKGLSIDILPTPKAIKVWNDASGAMLGLFHVTC